VAHAQGTHQRCCSALLQDSKVWSHIAAVCVLPRWENVQRCQRARAATTFDSCRRVSTIECRHYIQWMDEWMNVRDRTQYNAMQRNATQRNVTQHNTLYRYLLEMNEWIKLTYVSFLFLSYLKITNVIQNETKPHTAWDSARHCSRLDWSCRIHPLEGTESKRIRTKCPSEARAMQQ